MTRREHAYIRCTKEDDGVTWVARCKCGWSTEPAASKVAAMGAVVQHIADHDGPLDGYPPLDDVMPDLTCGHRAFNNPSGPLAWCATCVGWREKVTDPCMS